MAFPPILRPLSSPSRLLSTIVSRTADDSAAHFCHLLQSNSSTPTLERELSHSRTKLDPSIVDSVLRRFPSSSSSAADRISALRFFVWAGLQPNHRHSAAAYAAVSDSLQLSRHPQSVSRLLEAYREDGSPVSMKTFRILLSLCRAAGLPEEALFLLRRMPEFGCRPDTPSYNAVLRLHTDGEVGAALLQEMVLTGLQPDMVTYVSIVKGLCTAGQLESARTLVAQMRVNGCVPNVVVHSALLDGACRCGDLDAAVEILEEMEDGSGPNVVSYTCLIKYLCEKGRVEEALGVFDRMGLRGCGPNRVTVTTLVNGFCAEGRIGDAFELVERVVREGSVSSEECYSSLVVCLLRTGKTEKAEGLIERILQVGVQLDGLACNSLMRELCSQRLFLDGYRWIDKFEGNGWTCIDCDVYSLVLEGLCEVGHVIEAATLAKGIVERGIRLETACINDIVEVLKMNGHGNLALQILRREGP